jgi:lipoprotein-releasing system ATP-binding protein
MSDGAALRLDRVVRTFVQGPSRLEVLRGASLSLAPGEIVALVGPSGAGKSTLLHVAGLLERADGGEVYILGRPCGRMSDTDRTAARRRMVGFVYQYHHLLPEFSALENVVIPQMIAGKSRREARQRAAQLLDMVGLSKRASHRPARLSGGEQQRVAMARALANKPAILLADEPTGNLDPHTAESVFALLRQLVHEARLAALIATHNLALSSRMDRVLTLQEGHVEETHRSELAPATAR